MQIVRMATALLALCGLAACGDQGEIQAIDVTQISKVIGEIKNQVGDFQATTLAIYNQEIPDPADPYLTGPQVCVNEKGQRLTFSITKIKMDLTATVDRTTSGSIAIAIPITAFGGGSAGLGVSASHEVIGTQGLTFYSYTFSGNEGPSGPGTKPQRRDPHGSITAALISLRSALIAASMRGPCFNAASSAATPPENTVSYALTIVDTGGGNFSLKLGPIAASAGQTVTSKSGNTITVSYVATYDPSKPSTPGDRPYYVPYNLIKLMDDRKARPDR